MAGAVSGGACDRLFGRPVARRIRYEWTLRIEEHIVFPTPIAGDKSVGYPGRVPASDPLGGRWRELSEISYRGWKLSRLGRGPHKVAEFVLGEILTLWGFETDPVVAEVLSRLRATRSTSPSTNAMTATMPWRDRPRLPHPKRHRTAKNTYAPPDNAQSY
jgi:hypothetical protein